MQHTRFIANKTIIFNFSIWRTSAVNRRENCLSGKFPINPGKIALLPRAGFRTDWHVSEAKSLICERCRIMQFSAENFRENTEKCMYLVVHDVAVVVVVVWHRQGQVQVFRTLKISISCQNYGKKYEVRIYEKQWDFECVFVSGKSIKKWLTVSLFVFVIHF